MAEENAVPYSAAMTPNPQPSRAAFRWSCLAGVLLVLCVVIVANQPDRPTPTIFPGSSSAPTFVVQIIRPRLGLPLGGILPPEFFGLEEHLGFDTTSAGASIGKISPHRLEFSADDWDLVIALDANGRVTARSYVVFELMFEERLRRVRCRPTDPVVGTINTSLLPDSDEFSGDFDITLDSCEDADTGEPLGWPPEPLILHGSFDRLPQ